MTVGKGLGNGECCHGIAGTAHRAREAASRPRWVDPWQPRRGTRSGVGEHLDRTLDNVNLYVTDQKPKIAITVTDAFLSIGFFYRSGSYDFTRDLICTSPEALKFGMDLVDHYRKTARKMV